jgi:hypothetical protein
MTGGAYHMHLVSTASILGKERRFNRGGREGRPVRMKNCPCSTASPNIMMQPTGLIDKHFAREKSKMLTNEARG